MKCTDTVQRTHGTHTITTIDVSSAINRLKHTKKGGDSKVVSAGGCLGVHIDILFTAMLGHGLTSDGILNVTMIPIPKGTWANLSSSDTLSAITLDSILCKLLDDIIF